MSEVINRESAARWARQAQGVAGSGARDATNWSRNRASEGRWGQTGANQFFQSLWSGHMSPTTRTLVGLAGGGLFLYGLTQKAPLACILGTVGLALAAEAFTNASMRDIAKLPEQAADMASKAATGVVETLGFGNVPGHAGIHN
jgi:uncharacterized membrane protein